MVGCLGKDKRSEAAAEEARSGKSSRAGEAGALGYWSIVELGILGVLGVVQLSDDGTGSVSPEGFSKLFLKGARLQCCVANSEGVQVLSGRY